MCNRTKTEILARELCIQFWIGAKTNGTVDTKLSDYVDTMWTFYINDAEKLLKLLDSHK